MSDRLPQLFFLKYISDKSYRLKLLIHLYRNNTVEDCYKNGFVIKLLEDKKEYSSYARARCTFCNRSGKVHVDYYLNCYHKKIVSGSLVQYKQNVDHSASWAFIGILFFAIAASSIMVTITNRADSNFNNRVTAAAKTEQYKIGEKPICNIVGSEHSSTRTAVSCEVEAKLKQSGYYTVRYKDPDSNTTLSSEENVLDIWRQN